MKNLRQLILFIFILLILKSLYSQDYISIQNKFLKVIVDRNTGQFYAKTLEGDPKYSFDNNKRIIDKYNSTFLSLKIDDFVFKYSEKSGTFIEKFYKEDNKLKSIWQSRNIKIFQTLELIKSPYSDITNTLRITYKILNIDSYPHTIGARLLLDTSIGNDDIKIFRLLDNRVISKERELKKTETPFFWFGYKNLLDPGVFVFNKFPNNNQPDKIVFAALAKISKTLWDYKVNNNNDFRKAIITMPDSAVAIYWEPKKIMPGEIIKFSTDYGLFNANYKKNDNIVFLMINSKYITNNSPANIIIKVKNITKTNINNMRITIKPSSKLKVYKTKSYTDKLKKQFSLGLNTTIDSVSNINGTYPFSINITGDLKNSPISYNYTDTVIVKKYITNFNKTNEANIITNKVVINTNKKNEKIKIENIEKKTNEQIKIPYQTTKKTNKNTIYKTSINTNFIEGSFMIYYIRKGDTLSQILARIFKVYNWHKLKKYINAIGIYNKLKNNDLIYEHNYIFIPCINIKKEISIKKLSKKLNIKPKRIKFLSNKNNKKLIPGDVIILDNIPFLKSGNILISR